MAKKLKAGDTVESLAPTDEDRAEIIREVAESLLGIQRRRKKLSEEEQEHRGKLKSLGITQVDFNSEFRMYKIDDENAKEAAMKARREVHAALHNGETGDLFGSAAAATAAETTARSGGKTKGDGAGKTKSQAPGVDEWEQKKDTARKAGAKAYEDGKDRAWVVEQSKQFEEAPLQRAMLAGFDDRQAEGGDGKTKTKAKGGAEIGEHVGHA